MAGFRGLFARICSSARAPVQGCSEFVGVRLRPQRAFQRVGEAKRGCGRCADIEPAGSDRPSGVGNDLSDRLVPTEAIERLETGVASSSTLPSADAICWMRATECRWSSIASAAVDALRVTTANVFRLECVRRRTWVVSRNKVRIGRCGGSAQESTSEMPTA
jgi:hypothetical protein